MNRPSFTIREWERADNAREPIAKCVDADEALRVYDERRGHVVVTDDASGLPAELDRLCGIRS